MSERFLERKHAFEFIISIIRLVSSDLEWDIEDRGIERQREFLQCQGIDERFDGRSCLSRSPHHIILSLDSGIEIIDGSYICENIAVLAVQINHGAIIGSIILEHGIIGKDSLFSDLLDLAIKRRLDDESSFVQSTGSIGLLKLFDDPLDEMRSFDREGILAEYIIDALDDSFLEFLISDISILIHPVQCDILPSVGVFHIKRGS